tara:strand:+ start:40977 stop:41504 length:528 start_codon:yes stop_codon:yes gene_type:complete
MSFKHILLLFLAFILMSFSFYKELNKKIDKEIKATYGIENYSYSFTEIPENILKELPSKFDDENLLSIKVDDALVGYVYTGKAPSKTDTFEFLVLLDKNLIVLKTKVLVYREDYGGEIGSKRWLKQFTGKTQNDDLRYGDNIVAISGATISVRSMTNAMNNLLKSLKVLHTKNIL